MGRKLDALLGRNFKTSKFKTLAKLAISRIGILKNQHQVRCSHARSDVIELLNLGHHEQALLRVDHLVKEQNMVDAFSMMESYCNLLIDRVMLIQKNKECPDELNEATSSLMFASSRCGEIPELLHIRGILSSTFGKEFIARAVELRNSCSVHPKMIQKLSTRRPSLETKLKLLKEIASEKGITLHLEEMVVVEEKPDVNEKKGESIGNKSEKLQDSANESFGESIKARRKYRDVADAAQEAFESAAHAAAAARAAVELSRIGHQGFDSDDQSGSGHKNEAKVDSDALPAVGSKDETIARTSTDLEPNDIEDIKQKLWIESRVFSTSSSDISDEGSPSLDQLTDAMLDTGDHMEKAKEDISAEEKQSFEQLRENDDELAISVFDTNHLSSDTTQDEENNFEDESKSSKLTNTESLNFEEPFHSHVSKKWVSMRTR